MTRVSQKPYWKDTLRHMKAEMERQRRHLVVVINIQAPRPRPPWRRLVWLLAPGLLLLLALGRTLYHWAKAQA